ncbi:MAG: hypothetical protein [Wendovervirus sonii]|uniref:Uncharacterized protein n=1 Tax=phage Lak_Megaphage_Sonny TaxID=3109229 RepID=A0ABZ0Z370_9CAUD|nr:MAG: hypothetical protein [phage Lak_Megaphage_Sonny]
MGNRELHEKILQSIQKGVITGINEYENLNEGKLKNFLLGTAIATSVAGGMTSCANLNPAQNPEHTETQHINYPDYSDRPWAYESYIGRNIQATYLVIEDKYKIKKLCLDLPTMIEDYEKDGYEYQADWQDCAWAISYIKTEKRDKYSVDIYHTYGQPLFDEPQDGEMLDGACYFEIWYSDDETKSLEERIQFIRIYRNEDEMKETRWTVKVDDIKGTGYLDIKEGI